MLNRHLFNVLCLLGTAVYIYFLSDVIICIFLDFFSFQYHFLIRLISRMYSLSECVHSMRCIPTWIEMK